MVRSNFLFTANASLHTNGSEFFFIIITFVVSPHLDENHVVFGRVVKGIDVIKKIKWLPTTDQGRPVIPLGFQIVVKFLQEKKMV